ncbi:TIGR02221 family CRISPR-associated protein [Intestinibacter bartlettii]|uniref:CRISPR-associated (Cas) DxTHG family protein n=3 Tax=root TaxID=1 RepID=A0A6N3FRX2_9FIRM
MAKKFLSFLGGSTYTKCIYKYADLSENKKREYQTYFIQEALTEILCEDWNKDDEVIIFLTDRAKNYNWIKNDNVKVRNSDRPEKRKGLEFDLKRHNLNYDETDISIKKNKKFKIKSIDIRDGNCIEEIWENFDIVIDQINEGDEIIFDITHAFRYIPMLALVVLSYAKVLKNIKIEGIYYGNFEYKNDEYQNPEFKDNQRPIMNLIQLSEILEWSQAVNSFVKYGISDHIYSFANEILNSENNQLYYKEDKKEIEQLVKSLNDFTKTIQTCRGRTIGQSNEKNSIFKAYEKLNENLNKLLENKSNNTMKPLVHITGKIEEVISSFKPKDQREEVINTGLGVVKWSLYNNLIQQAFTALLETMISYMCILLNLEGVGNVAAYNDRKKREKANDEANKYYYKYITKCKNQGKNVKFESYEEELSYIMGNLKKIRNDINHYGYSYYGEGYSDKKPSKSYKELADLVKNSYQHFLKFVQKIENEK